MAVNLTNERICIEKPLKNEEHIMKDLINNSNSQDHFKQLRAAFLTKKTWPKNAKITISFVSSPTDNISWTPIAILYGSSTKLDPIEEKLRTLSPIEAVKKIVRERIQPIVGVKFVFVEQGGSVRIGFNPYGGTFSLIGTDCIKSKDTVTMNFAWLDAGTIMHEFGHVLGMIHEHQNPKGKTILWNDSKVYKWAKQTQGWDKETTYHNIIERYKTDQINGSAYDKYSIMEYFFPDYLTTNGIGTPNNHRLSEKDINYISSIYPGGRIPPKEFYNNIYGNSNQPTNHMKQWKIVGYISIGIAILVVIFFVIKFGKLKGLSINYSDWRKTHGGSSHSFTPRRYT
jgi:hypothetical protein